MTGFIQHCGFSPENKKVNLNKITPTDHASAGIPQNVYR